MQTSADRLDIIDGGRVVHIARSFPWRSAKSPERCRRALAAGGHLRNPRTWSYPYGVHVAVVRVDAETGGVAIEALRHGL